MTSVVDSITKLNITGNVIPSTWWTKITMPSGKPDCNAVVLLSEIIYWYRARVTRDETTGSVVRTDKRFKADKLQRSYQSLADQFGFTKRQVQEAMYRLRDAGLITLELRTINSDCGSAISNVLFIEPVPEEIERITYGNTDEDVAGRSDSTSDEKGELSHQNVTPSHVLTCDPIPLKRETYTETTNTETTTEKKDPLSRKRDDGVNDVLEHLNAVTGSKYRATTHSHAKEIRGRLDQGHTVTELRMVIDYKAGEWLGDPKMSQYLRPQTLFNAGKFDGYLTAAKTKAHDPLANLSAVSRKNAQNLAGGW